jgi:galactitol-specific phosphotransferase system IIB component
MKTGQRTKKKILCSCGTCSSSCTAVKEQVVDFLAENGIEAEFAKCNTIDIEDCYRDADLIISAAQLPPKIDKPKISSVPFFTGNGIEEAKREILKILK